MNAGPHHRYVVSGALVHNCGYGGGLGALKKMGGDKMGLTDDEMAGIVRKWRKASPNIVNLWGDMETAAVTCIDGRAPQTVGEACRFEMDGGALTMRLRSGRRLYYQGAHLTENRWGATSVGYMGVNQQTRKWTELETYGGKLVENLVQATARDLLAVALLRLDAAGYEVVGHIHDEVIIEAEPGQTVEEAARIMCEPVEWSRGLVLNADGFETPYYMKD